MNKTTTSTFSVSDVSRATTLLGEVPYKEAVEALLKTSLRERRLRSVMTRPLEACARYHGHLVTGVPFHPVVAAAHRAFMDHRPLCLSPDIIWLMICQGVANHINASAETLRSRFVRHEGKVELRVRRDDFVKGSPENPWALAIEELTSKVEAHVGSGFDLFRPMFTTTGPVERAAAGVVLLDAMRSYFTYAVETLCGIPAVCLEGTSEDWQTLACRAEQFGSLGLEWWLEPLGVILQQFVAASQGVVDRGFWQSIYRYHDESGGPMITGWISSLFPYVKDGRTGLAIHRNPWLTVNSQSVENIDADLDDEIDDIEVDDDEYDDIEDIDVDEEDSDPKVRARALYRIELRGRRRKDATDGINLDLDEEFDDDVDDDLEDVDAVWLSPMPKRTRDESDVGLGLNGDGPSLSAIPSGLSKAPFRWEYLDRSFDMEFLGGFVGVSQDRETLAVKPEIGWAVREATANE